MAAFRIVFAGPLGAGKTTAVAALSDAPPMSTEVESAEARAAGKATTTVAFDYGQIVLPSGDVLLLYGSPGQERFDFMWSIVSENAIGAVVLANNTLPDTIKRTLDYVRAFAPRVAAGNCVVGIGRTEQAPLPSVDTYIDALSAAGFEIPVMAIDVRERAHNLLLLDVLLARLEAERKLAA